MECVPADFYKVFGAAFRRNARWSTNQPVPDLGDETTPLAQVDAFYAFWFSFKSWREFPHPDEEDIEQVGGGGCVRAVWALAVGLAVCWLCVLCMLCMRAAMSGDLAVGVGRGRHPGGRLIKPAAPHPSPPDSTSAHIPLLLPPLHRTATGGVARPPALDRAHQQQAAGEGQEGRVPAHPGVCGDGRAPGPAVRAALSHPSHASLIRMCCLAALRCAA